MATLLRSAIQRFHLWVPRQPALQARTSRRRFPLTRPAMRHLAGLFSRSFAGFTELIAYGLYLFRTSTTGLQKTMREMCGSITLELSRAFHRRKKRMDRAVSI